MSQSPRLSLAGFIIAAFAAAALGSAATASSVHTWYAGLQKPAWTPPNGLFAPVWTFLYILMAVAAWRVWRTQTPPASRRTLWLYLAQLALNALWSLLFFGLRRPDLALAEVIVFWTLLVVLLFRFRTADRLAGWLWAPYVAWVTYASALNAAVWWLNR
jgi:tryptophan-rich sensory protein